MTVINQLKIGLDIVQKFETGLKYVWYLSQILKLKRGKIQKNIATTCKNFKWNLIQTSEDTLHLPYENFNEAPDNLVPWIDEESYQNVKMIVMQWCSLAG